MAGVVRSVLCSWVFVCARTCVCVCVVVSGVGGVRPVGVGWMCGVCVYVVGPGGSCSRSKVVWLVGAARFVL